MSSTYLIKNLLNFFLALVQGFLGLRFLLKLFGANPNTGFVAWVYEMSGALLEPFRAIFPTQVFENRFVVEFSTLFAMLIYALLGMLLFYLIDFLASAAAPDTVVEHHDVDDDLEIAEERPRLRRRKH